MCVARGSGLFRCGAGKGQSGDDLLSRATGTVPIELVR